jgi:hypothetical protein
MIKFKDKYYIATQETDERKIRENDLYWEEDHDLKSFILSCFDSYVDDLYPIMKIYVVNPNNRGILTRIDNMLLWSKEFNLTHVYTFWGEYYDVFGVIYADVVYDDQVSYYSFNNMKEFRQSLIGVE